MRVRVFSRSVEGQKRPWGIFFIAYKVFGSWIVSDIPVHHDGIQIRPVGQVGNKQRVTGRLTPWGICAQAGKSGNILFSGRTPTDKKPFISIPSQLIYRITAYAAGFQVR